jgi:hypothetical protein
MWGLYLSIFRSNLIPFCTLSLISSSYIPCSACFFSIYHYLSTTPIVPVLLSSLPLTPLPTLAFLGPVALLCPVVPALLIFIPFAFALAKVIIRIKKREGTRSLVVLFLFLPSFLCSLCPLVHTQRVGTQALKGLEEASHRGNGSEG